MSVPSSLLPSTQHASDGLSYSSGGLRRSFLDGAHTCSSAILTMFKLLPSEFHYLRITHISQRNVESSIFLRSLGTCLATPRSLLDQVLFTAESSHSWFCNSTIILSCRVAHLLTHSFPSCLAKQRIYVFNGADCSD